MAKARTGGMRAAIILACIASCTAFSTPLPSSGVLLRRTGAGSGIMRGRKMAHPSARGSTMQCNPNPSNAPASLSLPVSPPFSSASLVPRLPLLLPLAILLFNVSPAFAATAAQLPPGVVAKPVFEPRGVTQQDLIVFAVCCFPFLWATVEFWRRIAVGEPFGTGKDSVVISNLPDDAAARQTLLGEEGEEGSAVPAGGRRTLTVGAIRVAYVLFAAVGGTVALVALAASQLPLTAAPPAP